MNRRLEYTSPADLRNDYSTFFWNVVHRYIKDGLRHLQVTQAGKQWVASLYAHVFSVEHTEPLVTTIPL